ncbi:MAG: TlpA disulfide reductase family protein [Myxococcaceae bacterium]
MRTLLVVSAIVALSACVKREPLPPLTGGSPTDSVAPLSLELPKYPDGQKVDLAKDRGNVVLLDVWATWCEPCRDALPTYEALQQEYGKKGLKIYALNVDEDQSLIPQFLQETKVTLPILLDRNGQTAEKLLKVKLMPTAFLIDKRGVIRHVHEGFAEEFLQQYQTEIETLLAEKRE